MVLPVVLCGCSDGLLCSGGGEVDDICLFNEQSKTVKSRNH